MATLTIKDYPLSTISVGDLVTIAGASYRVHETFLGLEDCIDHVSKKKNATIFDILGISEEEKIKFVSSCYGYPAFDGDFPDYHDNDMNAALKVINALFAKSAEQGVETPKKSVGVARNKNETIFTIRGTKIRIVGHPIYNLKSRENGNIQELSEPAKKFSSW